MKPLIGRPFDQWRDCSERVLKHYGSAGDAYAGCFNVPVLQTGEKLYAIASAGGGWEHVSVSHLRRCPTWEEMVYIKRAFFQKDEWALEFHPPEKDNISVHAFCLHIWRPQHGLIDCPPPWMIG